MNNVYAGQRHDRLVESTDPKDNAAKVRGMYEGLFDCADLYRRIEAGPSGQRRNLLVGRAYYVDVDRGEFKIIDMSGNGGDTVGWATRTHHGGALMYALYSEDYYGGTSLVGWSETLSLGVDVLVWGVHAATGRHDARRTSGGRFEAHKPLTPEEWDALHPL